MNLFDFVMNIDMSLDGFGNFRQRLVVVSTFELSFRSVGVGRAQNSSFLVSHLDIITTEFH